MKIEIKNLNHNYDVNVLKNINLKLEGYDSIAIIGVSGSGKSTLIRLLSGLEKPTTGEIKINDLSVNNKEYREQIGFVFQNHNLFPHLTILENITLILEKTRNYNKEEAKSKALLNLEKLKLLDQINEHPKNISGGQAQRASIARALALNSNIIYLDEPTSSLDPILTDEVLSSIEDLKDLGNSFVFVTHEIGRAHV